LALLQIDSQLPHRELIARAQLLHVWRTDSPGELGIERHRISGIDMEQAPLASCWQ
jgi:hypothetical protein